jgi:pyruvate dehydrogenase E2 component (dihydrolipoamide acetyltransferase)
MTPLRGWRRVASVLWNEPADPQIYGIMELEATPLLDFMRRAQAAGHRVTPTHLVGRALAVAMHAVPDSNVRIWGGHAYPRESIDIFFVAAIEGGRDLSGVKIRRADERSAIEIASELGSRAKKLKTGRDTEFNAAKRAMELMPRALLGRVLRASAHLAGDHNVDLRALGLAASPFGSAMVTSVGMLGLPIGFAPLAYMYKVPILLLVGEIADKPVAVAGKVEVRPVLPVTATVDHRYMDGAHLGDLLRAFKQYLADPAATDAIPASAAT